MECDFIDQRTLAFSSMMLGGCEASGGKAEPRASIPCSGQCPHRDQYLPLRPVERAPGQCGHSFLLGVGSFLEWPGNTEEAVSSFCFVLILYLLSNLLVCSAFLFKE